MKAGIVGGALLPCDPMRNLIIGLALLTAATAVADESAPQRRIGLLLVPERSSDAARVGQLTTLLTTELERRGVERARMIGPYDPTALSEGRTLLSEARTVLSSDHRMQRASESEGLLTRAFFGLKSALGDATLEELTEVHVGMAMTRLADGDRRLASSYLRTAMNLNAELAEGDFFGNSAMRDLFRELKAGASTLGSGSVRVQTEPAGAEVYLGDELKGYSPLSLELTQGTHLIRILKDGYYTYGWLTEVRSSPTTLRKDLQPMGGRSRLAQHVTYLRSSRNWRRRSSEEARTEAAAGIRRLLRCTDLVVATVRRTRDAYRLSGAIAPQGQAVERLQLELAVDATLLDRIRVLAVEWAP